ncbi:MAG: YbaB/EbfC family nucleoid-associated protein [Clostridia bacterium]|nr:YbaB/EbfC family nucleoid-associated protein [Clostridia bacterium]
MAGFKGGMGGMNGMNMQAMMKQAQKIQEEMKKAQEELEDSLFDGTAGGGLVTVTLDGKKRVDAIKIEPDAVDLDDLEMLEDLLIAAFNDAYKQVEEYEEEILPEGMAGLGL